MPTITAPQSVSRRYPHALLARGRNARYEIEKIEQKIAQTPGGLPVGFYFHAIVKQTVGFQGHTGEGMTPVEAVTNALISAGVTFR